MGARNHVEGLRSQAQNVTKDNERIQSQIDGLLMERKWVITQARKGSISEKDMEEQLAEISAQELALKKEMGTVADLDLLAALDGWEEKAREYFADLQAGLEELNAVPQTDEERLEQFEIKRRVVNTLVEKVTILKNRDLKITFRLNLLALAQKYLSVDQVPQVGTYTPRPIIAGDFIQKEPLVDLLLRFRDDAYSAYRLTIRPGQLLVYRDAMTPLEIHTSLDDELWIPLKGESHHVERHYETAPGRFNMAIETKSWLVTDVLQIRWQTDSSLPGWASAVFIEDMAGRTICRYIFGKNLTDTSGGQAAFEPVHCTACGYPREAALYYVEYNRSFKSGAITHSWAFLCKKHLEEKRQWVLEDPAHRAMRWLPVEEVPLRKFAYQLAHLTAVPEFWKVSYLGERSLFYLDLREVFRSHWGFSKRDAQWIHHFVESCLRNQDTTLDNLAQILDEEHLPPAIITYLRNTLLIPAAI